jgi:hypothetical protein
LHKGLDNPTYPEINRDELIIKTGEVLNWGTKFGAYAGIRRMI